MAPQHRAVRSAASANVDYRAMVGTRDSRPSGKILARQVLDAKAAGSLQTHAALAHAAGVDPTAVARLRVADKSHAPPQDRTCQVLLRPDDSLPALVCTQETRVDGESANETHSRCVRNFRRRQAVLRAAGAAAAARATEVSGRVRPLACTFYLSTTTATTVASKLRRRNAASFASPTALMRASMDAATHSARIASCSGVTLANSRPALRAALR